MKNKLVLILCIFLIVNVSCIFTPFGNNNDESKLITNEIIEDNKESVDDFEEKSTNEKSNGNTKANSDGSNETIITVTPSASENMDYGSNIDDFIKDYEIFAEVAGNMMNRVGENFDIDEFSELVDEVLITHNALNKNNWPSQFKESRGYIEKGIYGLDLANIVLRLTNYGNEEEDKCGMSDDLADQASTYIMEAREFFYSQYDNYDPEYEKYSPSNLQLTRCDEVSFYLQGFFYMYMSVGHQPITDYIRNN
ncbi:MAG: hypothetical protein Q7U53_17565 [Anaerolineaceae bacterium]|nr:hypothetical protein [Anaerolineaceae bacterium]